MGRELQNRRPDLDEFVADLTEAAYPIALRQQKGENWLDLQMSLWKVMAQTVKKWEQRSALHLS
jgi:hypothetical protein